ncbi:MAG: N-6 DNA methylase [Beijerinckiaceae bacterium]
MIISERELQDTVAELARRPGYEKVRTLVHKLLTDSLGARSEDISYEHRLPEVKGRIDALLGRTVIEIKSDLRREQADAEAQLARYLPHRELETGHRYVGVATDGAKFVTYEMRDGTLVPLTEQEARPSEPHSLTAWLEGVVTIQDRLPADALNIINELGRQSAAFARSLGLLGKAWRAVSGRPEIALRRQLWARHLGLVYGKAIEDDELWFQHTYLVVVAKAIAAGAMGFQNLRPDQLLSGTPFRAAGVHGAVEDDFFSWLLEAPGGDDVITRIYTHAARFDLGSVDVDLLKVLYESLIDPKHRHDLGEYYTPDWLARKVVRRAVDRPAEESVLDPACGSGSFLFHALRLKREALASSGDVAALEVAACCCSSVTGVDIHPVAVIFARVTYLLGLGDSLLKRSGDVSVPVYLGDALQWNVRRDAEQDLVVEVPSDPQREMKGSPLLRFPLELCADPVRFDRVIELMHDASQANRKPTAFVQALLAIGVQPGQLDTLAATYVTYDELRRSGRNHVWSFVARNLSRPVAISDGARADVVVGNPPWLSYRFMSKAMQSRFRDSARALGVWVGPDEARLVTQTDLSALFFARAAELYLRPATSERDGGRIAMVMPLAALTRGQFRKFRGGAWHGASVRFEEAWVLDNQEVQPLFRVPTCVLFAQRTHALATRVPSRVTAFAGRLPFKDAPEELADRHLTLFDAPAPTEVSFVAASPYRERFRQGATLVPRMLCLVERADAGRVGTSADAPLVRSRRSTLEKEPWINLEPLQGAVESEFLRRVYLGESIAPFRVLRAFEGIIPVLPHGDVLDARQAVDRGFTRLGAWMTESETLWNRYSAGARTLKQRWNYHNELGIQFPVAPVRVVFSKAGTQPAA